jgi:hypothetical protein
MPLPESAPEYVSEGFDLRTEAPEEMGILRDAQVSQAVMEQVPRNTPKSDSKNKLIKLDISWNTNIVHKEQKMKFIKSITLLITIFCGLITPAKAQLIGNAKPLEIDILGITGIYADTGNLPLLGGSLNSSLSSLNLFTGGMPSTTVVTSGLLTGNTSGSGSIVNSSAHLENVSILPGTFPSLTLLEADLIESFAQAAGSTRSGSVNITNLKVLGTAVSVTGSPNQSYIVPGILNLTINRQITNVDNSLTVQALYLDIVSPANIGTVILASSTAGAPEPTPGILMGIGSIAIVICRCKRRF